ncbi:MAG: hypothetical protein SGI88_04970 [Candidatus Hydrogenedentes bacterium]|nr:hypothetical protein [Candidatus Hydrogenedentota bacterium]
MNFALRRFTVMAALITASIPAIAQAPLRWSVYATNSSVEKLGADAETLKKAPDLLRGFGITKVYLEFFRGTPVANDKIKIVIDALTTAGFEVAGGIATLPGEGYGVREDAPLGWFNWQNPKTREDVAKVVATAAPLFREIIVDDFFCTNDKSPESVVAKGELPWSDYRRALMMDVAQNSILIPAKTANPAIMLTIKFPQWYDKFHEFGYDVVAESALFDRVGVGTESRGANTQRFGFTQAYHGFINYRWLSSIGLLKTSAAWFDYGDCDANDFVDQAYQSVLAGAPEIILFSYAQMEEEHPGNEALKKEQQRLAALSAAVQLSPVSGVAGYKPPNSDAATDPFIMDYIGMLGIPVVPSSQLPAGSRVIFLPAQAASDPGIGLFVRKAIAQRATIVMTPGFLATVPARDDMVRLAGLQGKITLTPMQATSMRTKGEEHAIPHGLSLAGNLFLGEAKPLLMANVGDKRVPFFTQHTVDGASIYVLNTRTFSQADYDAAGEVLLPPRRLGLIALPQAAVEVIRDAFTRPLGYTMDAPARVTLQPLGAAGYMIQNYNDRSVTVRLSAPYGGEGRLTDQFSGKSYASADDVEIMIGARGRAWLQAK